ncbi:hypothetical protein Mal64_36080 [Pseudobythopirellula maris]|uniref:TIR domain-containing protein n=2 Tax=Pseudobythopirellula maris TaxID=2527991 RepID=A0A5C5ZHW7_9BACT|nr:hypothetical protein Mal64_36080 [Pseudobythopirellula maris]
MTLGQEMNSGQEMLFGLGNAINPFQFPLHLKGAKVNLPYSDIDAVVLLLSDESPRSSELMKGVREAAISYRTRGVPLLIPVATSLSVPIPDAIAGMRILHLKSRTKEGYRATADAIDNVLDAYDNIKIAKEEERREVQEKVERSTGEYVQKSLANLKDREHVYRRLSYAWYGVALLSLVGGVAYGVWRAIMLQDKQPSWESLVQVGLVTVLVIGVLGALSRFAFLLGKAFMVESLRNSDRIHAISFGEFYLDAFGDKAEWSEVKEAFQHWNIDKGSTFIEQDAKDVDPQILLTALEIAKAISGARNVQDR